MTKESSALVCFYRGSDGDHRGRRIDDILSWNDQALESVHDYIQWLFPLDEPSAFNVSAPLVTIADREAFRTDPTLANNLRRSFDRMLAFYGLELVDEQVRRGTNWTERSEVWLHPHNHNYLRLTRILKSLKLLGQPDLAQALGEALLSEYRRSPDRVGATTADYWKAAVSF